MPLLPPVIVAPATFVTLPTFVKATPSYLPPEMLPLLVTVPAAPLTKTPFVVPVIEPVELLVRVPPSARSTPVLALMPPLFVIVPAALYLT